MSVTTQIFFPYMSDARTPAMDVQMTAQDVGMLRSFSVSLSAMLIVDDGYSDSTRYDFTGLQPRHQRCVYSGPNKALRVGLLTVNFGEKGKPTSFPPTRRGLRPQKTYYLRPKRD